MLAFVDFVMDVVTTALYFDAGHWWWAGLSLAIVVVSMGVGVLVGVLTYSRGNKWCQALFGAFGLGPLLLAVRGDDDGYKDAKAFESAVESAPQSLLQVYVTVALRYGETGDERLEGGLFVFAVVSAARAAVSGLWPLVSKAVNAHRIRELWQVAGVSVWMFSTLVADAVSTAALAANVGAWAAAKMGGVWLAAVAITTAGFRKRRSTICGDWFLSALASLGLPIGLGPPAYQFIVPGLDFDNLKPVQFFIYVLEIVALVPTVAIALMYDGDVHGICSDEDDFDDGGCFEMEMVVVLLTAASVSVVTNAVGGVMAFRKWRHASSSSTSAAPSRSADVTPAVA